MTGVFSVTPIFKKMLFTGSTGTGTKPACPRLKETEPGNSGWLGGTSLRDRGGGGGELRGELQALLCGGGMLSHSLFQY